MGVTRTVLVQYRYISSSPSSSKVSASYNHPFDSCSARIDWPRPDWYVEYTNCSDKADVTPIATTSTDAITPPRYKASPSAGRPSPSLTSSRQDSPRSVSLGTPSPAQEKLGTSTTSSFGTYSTPTQRRPRSSSGLTGRKFASGVGGSPLGIGGSPHSSGTGLLDSPASRKASMEVFFRG
jgi:hypothetical protein